MCECISNAIFMVARALAIINYNKRLISNELENNRVNEFSSDLTVLVQSPTCNLLFQCWCVTIINHMVSVILLSFSTVIASATDSLRGVDAHALRSRPANSGIFGINELFFFNHKICNDGVRMTSVVTNSRWLIETADLREEWLCIFISVIIRIPHILQWYM